MNSSSAKTMGIILVILAVLLGVGFLRALILIPLGIVDGVGHGLRSSVFDHDGWWLRPWAGFAGFFGLVFLVFWVVILIWVYRDAEKRGMEGVLWAILVFFTHFIGLIIYLIVRSGKPVSEKKPASPQPPPAPPAPVVAPPARPASCARCGKEIRPEWQVCPFCGEKI